MLIFKTQSMQEILLILQNKLDTQNKISFSVFNPDEAEGYAGNEVTLDGMTYIYRGLKSWMELAELLHCKMSLPMPSDFPMITLSLEKLNPDSFHNTPKDTEKYGLSSPFAQIHKMEEPSFVYYYLQALKNVNIKSRKDILNLGINRADEFETLKSSMNEADFNQLNLIGIDHSQTAIANARSRFPQDNITFYATDINEMEKLTLGEFDLLISIGTLQSPSINFKPFFMSLVQEYLKKDSAIILGFPNCRWIGGEMIYGAKAPNYAMSEQSLLYNDVMFCKKYLQQKKYRVTLTGKHYLFLTATKIT